MSVAFTREDSAQTAQEISLPERAISPHPNFVTAEGLAALEAVLSSARAAMEAAKTIADEGKRRRASELALRDMRYFTERVGSAQLRPAPTTHDRVAFGHRVTVTRDDARRQIFSIVGEDEADLAKGSISYVSPMARALSGKTVGDFVVVAGHEVEIVAID